MNSQLINEMDLAQTSHEADQGIRLLLVEDSETDAYATSRILESHMPMGCRISRATNIHEAQQILSADHNFSAVLLDLGLPDSVGGADAYERLKCFKDNVPIIVLTSTDDDNLAMQIVGIGAQDYVHKGSILRKPDILCRAIQFAIKRYSSLQSTRQEMSSELDQKNELLHMMMGSYSCGH